MVTELVEGETLQDWLKHSSAVEHGIEIAMVCLAPRPLLAPKHCRYSLKFVLMPAIVLA
jgi:hypothetical protein